MSEAAPSLPRRILGLDFSGAVDAGRRIWLAEGERCPGGGFRITDLRPAADLEGGARERETALAALRTHLRAAQGQRAAAIGCDFPFSLTLQAMAPLDWEAWVRGLSQRHASAQAWRAAVGRVLTERQLKRRTDTEAKTPFAPTNLRLFRQTWHGVTELLAPLMAEDRVRVLPFQAPDPGCLWLLETCPASALKRLGLYHECSPYKGPHDAAQVNRVRIAMALERQQGLSWATDALRALALENTGGDALDAVIAAWITYQALGRPDLPKPHGEDHYRWEGYVYA